MSKFKTVVHGTARPESPEALFRDLKGRSADIRHLWSHQADVLRAYHSEHLKTPDVALQLPTGSGKTLVGLLIAEYRRLAYDQRVVYLCPTRQLAYQVGAQAQRYGIKAHVLVGPQAEYDTGQYTDYITSKAIAVTTYNGVFNTNPRLNDAQVLILDDAHAAENYVTDMWTVSIDRKNDLYRDVLTLLAGSLPKNQVVRFLAEEADPNTFKWVEKVPMPLAYSLAPRLVELLDERVEQLGNAKFPWQTIRDNLAGCTIYVSWQEIVMRPVFPPTRTHSPFASAQQRVYMSATLGQAGDLERSVGVPTIARVPLPAGWDKQAVGRRLILFPDRSLSEGQALETAFLAMLTQERALVLCPDKTTQKRFVSEMGKVVSGYSVMGADSIEASLEPFTKSKQACLVLTNRYDGLDLPDDVCRLSIILGHPSSTNIQEKFLWSRLNATTLLRERVRTRLMQAFGRCTRNDTDYAAVLVIGQELFDFCARTENTSGMHPEIRAEVLFGIENSEAKATPDDFLGLLSSFYNQDSDWLDGNQVIVRLRNALTSELENGQDTLASTTRDEVEFNYALWKGDYSHALELARSVADKLGGDNLKGYRGWWYYLAASAAWLASQAHRKVSPAVAKELLGRAAQCAPSVRWLVDLAQTLSEDEPKTEPTQLDAAQSENLVNLVTGLGLIGPRFERKVTELIKNLDDKESTPFERGLDDLGRFLGFQTYKPSGHAAPDGIWFLGDRMIVFEAKSDAITDSVPVSTLRQAKGHYDWVKANMNLDANVKVVVVVVTPQTKRDEDTDPFVSEVGYVSVQSIRELARATTGKVRECRSRSSDRDNLGQELVKSMQAAGLAPDDVWKHLTKFTAAHLEVEKRGPSQSVATPRLMGTKRGQGVAPDAPRTGEEQGNPGETAAASRFNEAEAKQGDASVLSGVEDSKPEPGEAPGS